MSGFNLESNIRAMDCRNLPQIVEMFLDSIDQSSRAESTLKNYRIQCKALLQWLEEFGPTFDYQLRQKHLIHYAGWLQNEREPAYAHNTASGMLARAAHLFRWAFNEGYTDRNIARWVPQIQMVAREMRPVSVENAVRLFKMTEVGQYHLRARNRCLLALLFGTGARREEIACIKIENITLLDDDRGAIDLEVTKGGKPRTVVFGPGTGVFVREYLGTIDQPVGRLFSFKKPNAIYKALITLCEKADVPKFAPHDCRKMFATHWHTAYKGDRGLGQIFLKQQLGHSPGSDTTQKHYTWLSTQDMLDAFVSPMEDIYFALRDRGIEIQTGYEAIRAELEAEKVAYKAQVEKKIAELQAMLAEV